MATILILVHGTGGDIRQMSRIGGALRRCGHEVTVITHSTYERQVHSEGLNYAIIDTPEEYEQVLTETGRNLSFQEQLDYVQRRILPKLTIEHQLLRERLRPGETVLITHSNTSLAARTLAETLGLPLATAFTAPAFLAQVPIVEAVLGKALGPMVNQIRADFGLSPVGNWSRWWRKDSHPIALWPEWFAPPEPEWPADLVQAGFLMVDPPVPGALPPEAEAFLEAGDPPVLVTGGTGIFVEANYYQMCLDACRQLEKRVVLVARYQTHVPRSLPESVALFSVLPFASLMPRMAAVIHHGGLATLSQALASGVPQLVLARGLDRPDNAQRVERLGVGQYLPPVRWQAGAIAEALDSLIDRDAVRKRCQELARRIHAHDSLTPIANLIETILKSGQAVVPGQTSDSNEKMPAPDDPAPASDRGGTLNQLSQQRLELAVRLLRQKGGNGKTSKAPAVPPEPLTLKVTTDLNAEVVLDSAISAEGLPPATTGEPANIFLTGATGFLGAFLLHELLRQTTAAVHCLVRASGIAEGRQRLQRTLTTYGLWDESVSDRIVPIPGDLSKPQLGLAEAAFSRLAGTLDIIYHNGAQVNFVYPYATLKAPNVLGTHEVLRLACRVKAKPVHYVSTLSASSARLGEGFYMGYAQSKWVAEQLVTLAGSRGLPISVYRPGRITGHSQTGVCKTEDLLCKMIKGCLRLGSVPDLNDLRVDITPVDYVSRAIMHLSRQAEASGQTFPLLNPSSIPWQELVRWVTSLGYPLRQLSYEAWRAELLQVAGQSDEKALSFLLPVFSEKTSLEPIAMRAETLTSTPEREFQVQSALNLLQGASIVCPPANFDLFNIYFSYFRRSGFLEL